MIEIERFLILRKGEQAPAFTAKTLDGKDLKLADLRGKIVYLDFWATWCAPCIAELPTLQKAYDKYGAGGDLVVVAISLDEDPDTVRRFIEMKKIPWAQIVGGPTPDNKYATLYGVSGVPATFLLNREGKVVAKDLKGKMLEKELAKLLTPPTAEAKP